jgi:hypothetical protein
MHIATPEQEIHNSITITEIPTQTSMPDQATLENPSGVPQENQHAETTPEQTHIPTSEKCDDIPSDNQEHHIPQEAFVFLSDVEAEARKLEEKFRESLKLLVGYVQNKIKGRGMEIVNRVVEYAEHSSAPRTTNYNHEEERAIQEEMLAVVQENIRKAFKEAKRLAEEEAELARRAFEAEIKRLADQEAMKVLVERAVRIAEVELQKLAEAQEMGPKQDEDTIMVDQETVEPASDKCKDVVVDSTHSTSPVRTIRDSGSRSSVIPPAVQVALEEMKTEMKNEISEIKADMKTEISEMKADMNASGEATNKKIDEMMVFLQELARRLPKP